MEKENANDPISKNGKPPVTKKPVSDQTFHNPIPKVDTVTKKKRPRLRK